MTFWYFLQQYPKRKIIIHLDLIIHINNLLNNIIKKKLVECANLGHGSL
jgi:hypothetical protein